MDIAVAKRPLAGWSACGDDARYWRDEERVLLCIVDGLGHGREAEEAAQAAMVYVEAHRHKPLPEILAGCDRAIHHTRGVAMGLARVHRRRKKLTFAGVGNTCLLIWRGAQWMRFASANGIIGARFRRVSPEEIRLSAGDLGIMMTDGVSNQIDLSRYGSLPWQDLEAFAQRLLTDWALPGDDAAVITFRIGAEE